MVKRDIPKPREDKVWPSRVRLYSQAFEQLAARAVVHALRWRMILRTSKAILQSKINWVRPFSNKLTVGFEVNGEEERMLSYWCGTVTAFYWALAGINPENLDNVAHTKSWRKQINSQVLWYPSLPHIRILWIVTFRVELKICTPVLDT